MSKSRWEGAGLRGRGQLAAADGVMMTLAVAIACEADAGWPGAENVFLGGGKRGKR